MISCFDLKHHFKPRAGWMNDPNGLVYFQGYYHAFYQHAPHFESPWHEPMMWGHARTKDFIHWEELPIALPADQPYDCKGAWSGTAIVKDDTLYLFYASIAPLPENFSPAPGQKHIQNISVAFSKDGLHFEKYADNPIIREIPREGSFDFRDPAVMEKDGKYYCVIGSGNPDDQAARLLLYESADLFHWNYAGVLCEWANSVYCECPSFMPYGEKYLLTTSVCEKGKHYFSIMYGNFDGKHFIPEVTGEVHKGPDQYAGQVFLDHLGRHIMITWVPGWSYAAFAEKNLGCLSLPIELKIENGKVKGYPLPEVCHLLKDSDPAVQITNNGFRLDRVLRDPIIHEGKIDDIKILRDEYLIEIFINQGEYIYTAVLC